MLNFNNHLLLTVYLGISVKRYCFILLVSRGRFRYAFNTLIEESAKVGVGRLKLYCIIALHNIKIQQHGRKS
jgi:hypothetical protein